MLTATKQNPSEGDFLSNKNSYESPKEIGAITLQVLLFGKRTVRNKGKKNIKKTIKCFRS